MNQDGSQITRNVIFISKATPGDDEFVLWIAPRLEAAGFTVFADILSLEPGDRWRKNVTNTLQTKAIKMLLVCRDASLQRDGVQEEISIAEDLAQELKDERFIIPLRLEPFKKLFGIGGLQYVDFVGSWAKGLQELLESFERQRVPKALGGIVINPNWEAYRKRLAIEIKDQPETLTTNWLAITALPEVIRYYQPSGALDHAALARASAECPFPSEIYLRGFFSFAEQFEIDNSFAGAGKFVIQSDYKLNDFLEHGSTSPKILPREASNMLASMFRMGWERLLRGKSFYEYLYSKQIGFHVSENQVPLKKKVQWGPSAQRRSSMLRNISKGKVWQFGISAAPYFWPFPHFRLKSRVLFGDPTDTQSVMIIGDSAIQHRLRRRVCAGWRNKQWHGRLMAFLEVAASGEATLQIPMSSTANVIVSAVPIKVTVPITTDRPDEMAEDDEEQDLSTLGNVPIEEDD